MGIMDGNHNEEYTFVDGEIRGILGNVWFGGLEKAR
jgi:hypothetical protein